MKNKTVTLSRELTDKIESHLDLRANFDPSYPGETMPWNNEAVLLLELRAALAVPATPAGGEPEAVVAGWLRHEEDRGFIFTRSKPSAFAEPLYLHPTAYRMPSTEQAHATRLQAEVAYQEAQHEAATRYAQTCLMAEADALAERDALQSELTKARELLTKLSTKANIGYANKVEVDAFLANQSAPAVKDENKS